MKRQELALLLGVALVLLFVSISYLRQYLYLVLGTLGVVGMANTIYFWATRSARRVQSVAGLGVLSILSIFLSWYLWKKTLSSISLWTVGGIWLGAILGMVILHLLRVKKRRDA